ncbi:hypothetical protein, partial [Bacteroides xylanisolvens]|uniref:hypothetical protein n=1 Tax=Bacteroides xylanisolvens TaxID=371601 RepID=UPI001958EB09
SSIAKRKYSRTVKYKRGCANVLTQPLLHINTVSYAAGSGASPPPSFPPSPLPSFPLSGVLDTIAF